MEKRAKPTTIDLGGRVLPLNLKTNARARRMTLKIEPGGHALDSRRREGQPVDKGGADAVDPGVRDVDLVPCEDFGFMFPNQPGSGMERGFPLVEGRHGKRRLCLACSADKRGHQRGVITPPHFGIYICGTCIRSCRYNCHSLLP